MDKIILGCDYGQQKHIDKIKYNGIRNGMNDGQYCANAGKQFEIYVCKEIENSGFHIFGKNLKKHKEVFGKCEIDILLNKTIVECKGVKLSYFKGMRSLKEKNKLKKQITTYKEIFPDYKVIIWLKSIDDSIALIFNDINLTNIYFVDNIESLKEIYTEPKYYICNKFIIFSMISNFNKIDRHEHIYNNLYVKQELLTICSKFLNNPDEIQRFEHFVKKINIVEEYPKNSLEVMKNNGNHLFESMFCYQIKCYPLESVAK